MSEIYWIAVDNGNVFCSEGLTFADRFKVPGTGLELNYSLIEANRQISELEILVPELNARLRAVPVPKD